eukprot:361352-Chlamydomonas_euryale.AAC.2
MRGGPGIKAGEDQCVGWDQPPARQAVRNTCHGPPRRARCPAAAIARRRPLGACMDEDARSSDSEAARARGPASGPAVCNTTGRYATPVRHAPSRRLGGTRHTRPPCRTTCAPAGTSFPRARETHARRTPGRQPSAAPPCSARASGPASPPSGT